MQSQNIISFLELFLSIIISIDSGKKKMTASDMNITEKIRIITNWHNNKYSRWRFCENVHFTNTFLIDLLNINPQRNKYGKYR